MRPNTFWHEHSDQGIEKRRAVAGGTQAARPGTNDEAVYIKNQLLVTLPSSPCLVQSRLQGLWSVST